jgi:hypothetical protein
LTRNAQGLRLQVHAADGFLGGHLTYQAAEFSLRLRLLHLSAHLVDGNYSKSGKVWKDGREPIDFSRDFGELIAAGRWTRFSVNFMAYSGFRYSTFLRPDTIRRFSTIHGLEMYSGEIVGPVFSTPVNLFAAYNLSFDGIPEYVGSNSVDCGLKFGEWSGTGLRLFVSYYAGLDTFHQYYDERREGWGLGCTVDAW